MASVTGSELDLYKLLERADLLSYYEKFIEIGGDNVQQLRDSIGQELIDMVDMARKPLHVKRFKKALAQWEPQPVAATSTAADGAGGEIHELLRRADLLSYHDKFMEIGAENVHRLDDWMEEYSQDAVRLVQTARKTFHVKRYNEALELWVRNAGTWDSGTSAQMTPATFSTRQDEQSVSLEESPGTENIRTAMHLAIDSRDVGRVRECLQAEPQLKVWLHPVEKESALNRAVKQKAFRLYVLLVSEKCIFKDSEESESLLLLNPLEKSELVRQVKFGSEYKGSHLSALKSRSRSLAVFDGFDKFLDNLYDALDSSDLLKPVLKVASLAPYLRVRFDFKQEHIPCMVGGSRTGYGLTHPEKQVIFIGAKVLQLEPSHASQSRTKEVAGTLIHQLCHLAVDLVYRNEGKPYRSTDAMSRDWYADIVNDVRGRKDELHKMLKSALHWNDELIESELIVRIPHVLALCPAEGNTILEQQVPRLYQFFKRHVVEDMKQCIRNGCSISDIEIIKEENTRLGKTSSTEELGIEFVTRLDESILKREPLVVLVASNIAFLEVMVNDLLKSATGSYLFLEASRWGKRTEDVLIKNKCRFLLVSCDGKSDLKEILELCKQLFCVTGTKIVLMTSEGNLEHCLQEVENTSLHHSELYIDVIHSAAFVNLTPKCKSDIIRKSCIALQSHAEQTFIPDILDVDRFLKISREDTFLTLCRERVLFLGPRLKQLGENISGCYIEQKCGRSVEVDLCKIGGRAEDCAFAFFDCSEETLHSFLPAGLTAKRISDLEKFERIVILESDRDYELLVQREHYTSRTVHLLEFHERRFIWKKSNGAVSHLPTIGEEIYPGNSLLKTSERVVVVSGDPGTGKTILATRLCREIKKADKKAWVLYISDYPKIEDATRMFHEESGGINFEQFAKLCRVKTSGEEFKLFQQSVTKGSPFHVWVIFDALDEIQETSQKIILKFAKLLAQAKLTKVFIFMRTTCRNETEDEMHSVAYRMIPFSNEDQAQFQQKNQKHAHQIPSSVPNTKIDEKASRRHQAVPTTDLLPMAIKPLHVKSLNETAQEWTGHVGTSCSDTPTSPTQDVLPARVEESAETENIRAQMHRAIDDRNIKQVRRCLREEPRLKMWLHPLKKESALHRAVKKNAFMVYGVLMSRKCDFMDEAERDCLEHLNTLQKSEVERQESFFVKHETHYISVLKCSSTSAAECARFEQILDNLYGALDSNDLLKPILKVASMAPYLSIRFDFERKHTQCMAGGSRSEYGLTHSEKRNIVIGAMGLEDEQTDATKRRTRDVEESLAHELCHLALSLVYGNEGKPYWSTDARRRDFYADIIKDVRGRKDVLEGFLQLASPGNDEKELIVQIPRILARYPEDSSTVLEENVQGLNQFFKDYVVEDMIEYIQDSCPGKDIEMIRQENAILGRAFRTEDLGIEFQAPLDHCVLRHGPLLVLTASNLTLLEVMVNDLVRSERVSYLFLEASQWLQRTIKVLQKNRCNFLIVSCERKSNVGVILEFWKELHDVTGMKIILLTSNDNLEHCRQEISESPLCDMEIYVNTIHSATVQNVTSKCKIEIIKNARIDLQSPDGRSFLEDILDIDSFLEICEEDTFVKLCSKEILYFGPQLKKLEKNVSYCYIERRCGRSVEVDMLKIKECSKDDALAFLGCSEKTVQAFLPTGINVTRVSDLDRFEQNVILERESDYELLVQTGHYTGKTVHLLEFLKGHFMWRKSNGAVSHLPRIGQEIYTVRSLHTINEKVIVVSGHPGMGKTVLATRLCTEIKNADKNAWVLYVSEYPKRQEAMKLLNRQTGSINFKQFAKLCRVATRGEEFELFQQSVSKGSPFHVSVIFDAFDKIQDTSLKFILQFTKALAQAHLPKILMFTRDIYRYLIEDEMNVVSFHLIPFSEEDQAEFLGKYEKHVGEIPSSLPNAKSDEKQIQNIPRHVKEEESPLLGSLRGNPLFLRILAEVERGKTCGRDYSYENCFRCLSVFTSYVEYLLCHKQENKGYRRGTENENDDARLKSIFYKYLGLLALKTVLSRDVLEELLSESESYYLQGSRPLAMVVKENSVRCGLTQRLGSDDFRFVHHSYAEFFAAYLLAEKVKKANDTGDVNVLRIVSSLYGESRYSGMLTFFDGIAAKQHALHSSIMNNDIESAKKAAEQGRSLDGLERTPLHVAALHADPCILGWLTVNRSLTQRDMIGMTPLMYVDKIRSWARLDVFCTRSGGFAVDWFHQLPTAFENITTERHFNRSILYNVIYKRRKGLLSVLLREFCKNKMSSREICPEGAPQYFRERVNPDEHGNYIPVDIDRIKDDNQCTPLQMSVIFGELDIVQMLLPYSSLRVRNKFGMTPPQTCAFFGRTDILRLLLPLASFQDWYSSENALEGIECHTINMVLPGTVDFLLPHFLTGSPIKEQLLRSSLVGGHIEVTRAVLPHTDDRINRGITALQAGVLSGYLDAVRLMLSHTDVHGENKLGVTPLLMDVDDSCCSLNKSRPYRDRQSEDLEDGKGSKTGTAIAKLLILRSDIVSLGIDAKTALRIGMNCGNPVATFKLLLPHLSHTSRTTRQEITAHHPLKVGEQDILKYLISYTPINTLDEGGCIPLASCIHNRYLTAAKLLLPLTDVHNQSQSLFESIIGGECHVVEMLLPHSFERSCNTALLAAVHLGDTEKMKLLVPHAEVNGLAMTPMMASRRTVNRRDWPSTLLVLLHLPYLLPYLNTRDCDISHNGPLLLSACKTSKEKEEEEGEDEDKNEGEEEVVEEGDVQNGEMCVPDAKILKLLVLHSNFRIVDADRALQLDGSIQNIHTMKLLQPHSNIQKWTRISDNVNQVQEETADTLRCVLP
ncbi:uncharacterized protein LOC135373027 isoform X2 [Ornithodoros turicata]|uniref:uncharacterized protein LOC135373027 isoform X2 n=1 Tax=Ornithodoros turicata TaxID=34597 RepID=UPI003138DD69